MSISAAKHRANQLNAQKSTGPRTAEGKAASSRNAMTYGFFCQDLLLSTEDPQELADFQDQVLDRFRPRDAVESEIADQYLYSAWRLRRIRKTELHIYEERSYQLKQQALKHYQSKNLPLPEGFETMAANGPGLLGEMLADRCNMLEKLGRYEQRMFNTMLRCTKELRVLQKEQLDEQFEDDLDVQNEATEVSESNAQNEATAPSGSNAQNEATACSASDAQNEPTASPVNSNLSILNNLPAVPMQPLSSRSSPLSAAVEATLQNRANLRPRSVI